MVGGAGTSRFSLHAVPTDAVPPDVLPTDAVPPDVVSSYEPTRWARLTGSSSGSDYQARFDALADSGRYLHGEADLCASLIPAPARILDAGCGTGRVAIRLAELGYSCVGVDADDSMLAAARGRDAAVEWQLVDLSVGPLPSGFDLVVTAGNVIPLLAPGALTVTVENLAAALKPCGLLVTGFGLDQAHLPTNCPVTPLADFDAACVAAGLELHDRWATWDHAAFDGGGYAVSLHQLS